MADERRITSGPIPPKATLPSAPVVGVAVAHVSSESHLKDSGEREVLGTGGMREPNAGRGRYDLISPEGLRRLAVHYENGAIKYAENNWRKGLPASRCVNSAIRHLMGYLEGDASEDHLAAAIWNCMSVMQYEKDFEGNPEILDLLRHQVAALAAGNKEDKE